MAYTTINKSTDYFNTTLWTGDGNSTQNITGTGFNADWIWLKGRSGSGDHQLYDKVRGVQKMIISNGTNAESTNSIGLQTFGSDGFTMGSDMTGSGSTFTSWNWKANGQGSSNTDGSINTTYTSANTTSGFSISQYTGTGSNATVGHGMGVAPKMVIVKRLNSTSQWSVYHESIGNTKHLVLNTTAAESGASANYWNNTTPTTSVFSIGAGTDVNASGGTYVAYCFAEKQGYSKFGSYIGNGSATDGAFIYTGFVPAFVICKKTSGTDNWMMFTNKIGSSTDSTSGFNIHSRIIEANGSGAEQSVGTDQGLDFVSNGFKIREDNANLNGSGATYIYMAFAEAPLVGSNNVPATAR